MTKNYQQTEVSVSKTNLNWQRGTLALIVAPVFCIGLFVSVAVAQQPTPAQQSAIKSACRSDFMAQCSGVTPGGKAALSCLQQHNSSLSAGCQQAIGALGSGKSAPAAAGTAPATATAPAAPAAAAPAAAAPTFTPRQEIAIVRQECGPDFRALCRSVALGGPCDCLPEEEHARLSPGCQKVLTAGR